MPPSTGVSGRHSTTTPGSRPRRSSSRWSLRDGSARSRGVESSRVTSGQHRRLRCPRPAPRRLVVNGAGDPLDALVERLANAGLAGIRTRDFGPVRLRPAPGVVVRLTDGRQAADVSTESGETVVLVDLALDYATATRLAIAAPADAPAAAVDAAIGCLQAVGLDVTVLPDTPALVVARTVAMLAASGVDAVESGVASVATSTRPCGSASTIRWGRSNGATRWAGGGSKVSSPPSAPPRTRTDIG